ncbi:MAG: hypothetical protein PVJ44_20040, partial [Desulfobacterales bacterium]
MRKTDKKMIIKICGIGLLVIAVALVFLSTAPQKIADPQPSTSAVSKFEVSQKPAAAVSGRKLKKATIASTRVTSPETQERPYVFYPDNIMDLLGIDADWLAEQSLGTQNFAIHRDWMSRIDTILKNMDPEKKEAIIDNHTAMLAIKEALNQAYLSGRIDYETFKKSVADLLKWHQETYEAILSPTEYEALFEFKPEDADQIIDAMVNEAPRYSFILNQEIPAKEVTQQVQAYKLEDVNVNFNKMMLFRDNIGRRLESGELTQDDARAALNQSQQKFIAKCKEILTPEEINLIFGSIENLESGSTQTEPPAVVGTADIDQLGFKIENPQTSVAMVAEKLARDKIDSLNFLYEKKNFERDTLVERLDADEITPEQIEPLFNEIEST